MKKLLQKRLQQIVYVRRKVNGTYICILLRSKPDWLVTYKLQASSYISYTHFLFYKGVQKTNKY